MDSPDLHSTQSSGSTNSETDRVERTALRLVKPIVRWLVKKGVTYPRFAESLKLIFLDEARKELMGSAKLTDSALSVLSGVHRRDIRNFRAAQAALDLDTLNLAKDRLEPTSMNQRFGLAAQVVARWMTDPLYLDTAEQPLALARQGELSFDSLVTLVSRDIRPRAVLDQLERLGMVALDGDVVSLVVQSFTPRNDWKALSDSVVDNVGDHLTAGIANLSHNANWLEQALFSDEMTAHSVAQLHAAAAQTWRTNHRRLMQLAQKLYEHDMAHAAPEERRHRARLGMYFYSESTSKSEVKS